MTSLPRYLKYVFPVANDEDVCLEQTTGLGSPNFILNGNLSKNNNTPFSFISYGYARQLGFYSPDPNIANITITGTQNGATITEVIEAPSTGSPVYSDNSYDIITSITTDAPITRVSVGSGYNGYFPIINIDRWNFLAAYSLSLGATIGSNQIETAVYSTLDKISNNGQSFDSIIANNVGTLLTVKALSAQNLYVLPIADIRICRELLIGLVGNTNTLTNSTTLIFIQY